MDHLYKQWWIRSTNFHSEVTDKQFHNFIVFPGTGCWKFSKQISSHIQWQANKDWDILRCTKRQYWYGAKAAWIETVMYSSSFKRVAKIWFVWPLVIAIRIKWVRATSGAHLATARYTHTNQMRMCVDRTANMRCFICEWFTYHSSRTNISRVFTQTQMELGAPAGGGCPVSTSGSRKTNLSCA